MAEMTGMFWNSGAQDNCQQVIQDNIAMFAASTRQQQSQTKVDRISPDRVDPRSRGRPKDARGAGPGRPARGRRLRTHEPAGRRP